MPAPPALRLPRPYVLAHRGSSGYRPENTLSAFAHAVEIGAHGAETDVRATRDGVLVLMHDRDVDRTTDGRGLIAELTLAELRRLDAGSWLDPRYAGEQVPTLDDLLERFGGRLALTLEIVADGIAEQVVDLVRARGLLAPRPPAPGDPGQVAVPPVVFSSSRIERVRAVKEHAPDAFAALNVDDFEEGSVMLAADAGFEQLCPPGGSCTPERVAAAGARGLSVRATSIRDRALMRRAIEAGVDGMTCNWPDWLLEATR